MALTIEDPEADQLARDVAALTGESLTDAVKNALAERLERERRKRGVARNLAERLDAIAIACAALPVYDDRTMDHIIGYDERGMW
ncbi:MAG: type II toxin-antitoxin system VapB family antitoxin [Geminicoccaceae bacterium]